MRIRFTETAASDLDEILSYLRNVNPPVAARVLDAVDSAMRRISEFPESAQLTDESGIRMLPAGRFPYLIFYLIAENEVQIARVLHGARLRPWHDPEGNGEQE